MSSSPFRLCFATFSSFSLPIYGNGTFVNVVRPIKLLRPIFHESDRKPQKMVKHFSKNLSTNGLSVFDHFVRFSDIFWGYRNETLV